MSKERLHWHAVAVAVTLGLFLAAGSQTGLAQATPQTQSSQRMSKAAAKPGAKTIAPTFQAGLEPRAIEILKAACARLAAAKSMSFTALVSYESPSRLGPPLVYATQSEVTLQRPDKLRVITPGDGPASEFWYDGKTMTAFAPAENLVAIAEAPPTIDAALQKAYDTGATYFPFTDLVVADPYKDIADGLKIAFYIGQSSVVGGTTTDMVAYVTGEVFIQIWIGAQDQLPRRVDAVYLNDRTRLRHVLELSNWVLDAPVATDTFVATNAANASPVPFARPDAINDVPAMKRPPPKARSAKTD
jgi:hypothetical protein